ncbi:hypothetical protein A3860_37240 [Niastella vici]|uniref:Uncharacterized protein n=1 Tax=Niastella vici TaxID=1703345 RepID=A0A1V9FMI1_9BACT|nr:hypothetical protein [Niastella vici]OQP59559.1 hypothetical protein A3860_37240 [Niastella vici]
MRKNVFILGILKARGVKSIAFNHYNYILSSIIAFIFTYSVQTQMPIRLQGFLNAPEEPLKGFVIKKLPGKLSNDMNDARRGKNLYGKSGM